tara:strand:- start:26683 stop:27576 length:894 start_codon:yes stop_codon:yes gene_type:complete
MYRLLITLNCIFLFTFSIQAQTISDSNLTKVQGNVYIYQGKGGNIGLNIGTDGIFMIDDQFATETEQLLSEVKKVSTKPIEFLVNTHHHGDHTGGNANMNSNGTLIFSHDNVRSRLESMKNEEGFDAKTLPIITFSSEMNFHYNGEKIRVFHMHNAHTDGDAMVYFPKSNVLHTGDIFFNGKYPYIDIENGGTVDGTLNALKRVLEEVINEDTKIIPGHGPVGSKKDVDLAAEMLSFIEGRINYHYLDKKTIEEVLSMTDITSQFDDLGYGNGYITREKFIRMLYAEAEKKHNKQKF